MPKKERKLRAGYIKITQEVRGKLKDERKRTGVGFSKLLRGNPLKGVNSSLISGWVNGNIGTAKKQFVEQVFTLYAQLPTQKADVLSEATSKKLRQKIQQTGLSLERLLSLRDDVPKGLQAKSFYIGLRQQNTKTFNKDWGDYVLKVCNEYNSKRDKHERKKEQYLSQGALPVKRKHNYITNTSGFEPIPKEALKTIRQRHDVIKSLLDMIFKQKNTPKDLNQYIIHNWLQGNTKSAKPEHVQWVLDETKKLTNELLNNL